MNNQTHFSKTRKNQRLLTKYLKRLGLNASSKGAKQPSGWQTTIKGVSVSKPLKQVLKSTTGRKVQVIYKSNKV